MKKKMNEKKMCRGARMGYYPFLVLGHNIADCIATQDLGGQQGAQLGVHGQALGAERERRGEQ